MVVDLMNWSTESRRVKIKVTFKYATGSDATSRTNLRPWWLDVDGCSTRLADRSARSASATRTEK